MPQVQSSALIPAGQSLVRTSHDCTRSSVSTRGSRANLNFAPPIAVERGSLAVPIAGNGRLQTDSVQLSWATRVLCTPLLLAQVRAVQRWECIWDAASRPTRSMTSWSRVVRSSASVGGSVCSKSVTVFSARIQTIAKTFPTGTRRSG